MDRQHEVVDVSKKLKLENAKLFDTLGKKIAELESTLAGVQDFRNRQVQVEGELAEAKENAEKTRVDMARMAPDFERNFIEKCTHNKEEYEKKLQEVLERVDSLVEDGIGNRMKEILQQSEQLQQEIQIHIDGTTGLQRDRDALEAEGTNLSVEIGLLQKAEILYAKRGSAQARVIGDHAAKVVRLERSLRQVIRKYSAERSALEDHQKMVVAELEAEKQVLRRLVLGKTKEAKKVRYLAQHVLQQRGEVEKFLIESIQYVKEQIHNSGRLSSFKARDGEAHRKRDICIESENSECSVHFPFIRCPHSWPGARTPRHYELPTKSRGGWGASKPKFEKHEEFLRQLREVAEPLNQSDMLEETKDVRFRIAPKVDISQLSWSDREKVLRYLFQRINTVRQHGPQDISQPGDKRFANGLVSQGGRTLV